MRSTSYSSIPARQHRVTSLSFSISSIILIFYLYSLFGSSSSSETNSISLSTCPLLSGWISAPFASSKSSYKSILFNRACMREASSVLWLISLYTCCLTKRRASSSSNSRLSRLFSASFVSPLPKSVLDYEVGILHALGDYSDVSLWDLLSLSEFTFTSRSKC